MIVVFSIVAVITLIALYDYFQSRSWQQVTSDARNDTVFAQRNKQYGAYQMRRNYNKQLAVIIGGIVAGTGVLFAATRGNEVDNRTDAPRVVNDTTVVVITKPEKDPDPIMQTREESGPQPRTDLFVPPTPTDQEQERTDITVPDPNTAVSNQQNNEENGDPFSGVPGSGGNGSGQGPTETHDGPDDQGPMFVDEPAEFPGGYPALKAYLGENIRYPQIAIEMGLEGRAFLKFIVSKVGDISDVKVMRGVEDCPECDKEAVRVVRAMPNWKPGKINGKPVKSEFNLPVTFKLQKN